MKISFASKLIGIAIASPLLAWNYWAGTVAIFAHHPNFLQVWAASAILLFPIALTISEIPNQTILSRIMRAATVIALFAWVIRLVGIMPNAPF